MRFNKAILPDVVLYAGIAFLLLFLSLSFGLLRDAAGIEEQAARYAKAYDATVSERRQLQCYETTKEALSAVPDDAFSEKRFLKVVSDDLPAPDSLSLRKLDPADGFQGRRLDCSWKALDKRKAFQVLMALQSKRNPCWRLSEMKLEALPDGDRVSFRILLETAKSVDGDFTSYDGPVMETE